MGKAFLRLPVCCSPEKKQNACPPTARPTTPASPRLGSSKSPRPDVLQGTERPHAQPPPRWPDSLPTGSNKGVPRAESRAGQEDGELDAPMTLWAVSEDRIPGSFSDRERGRRARGPGASAGRLGAGILSRASARGRPRTGGGGPRAVALEVRGAVAPQHLSLCSQCPRDRPERGSWTQARGADPRRGGCSSARWA